MLPAPLLARFHTHTLLGCLQPDGKIQDSPAAPLLLFPGSFNPLHLGHQQLATTATRMLGQAVHFEISIANVDKPDLTVEETVNRAAAFRDVAPLWLTRAKTFVEKAAIFPGSTFVVGHDTAIRLLDARYYANADGVRIALETLAELNCRFVVGGRVDAGGVFREWDGVAVEEDFRHLFTAIREADFRVDLASRDLRKKH